MREARWGVVCVAAGGCGMLGAADGGCGMLGAAAGGCDSEVWCGMWGCGCICIDHKGNDITLPESRCVLLMPSLKLGVIDCYVGNDLSSVQCFYFLQITMVILGHVICIVARLIMEVHCVVFHYLFIFVFVCILVSGVAYVLYLQNKTAIGYIF